jgi:hypothetical protein
VFYETSRCLEDSYWEFEVPLLQGEKYKTLYKQILDVMDRFVQTEKLEECHHGYSSQKTNQ